MVGANPVNLSIAQVMAYDDWSSYRVQFGSDGIFVTVTHNPTIVCYWISKVRFLNYNTPPEQAIVGVRTKPKYPRNTNMMYHRVDVLQLCVNNHCLIYQIHHATDNIPEQFCEFLCDNRYTFVGLRIQDASEILYRDHGIRFGERIRDFSDLHARQINVWRCYLSIGSMTNSVIEMDFERQNAIDQSYWGALLLEPDQVMYACADAVVCYRAGLLLQVWNFEAP